MLSLKNNKKRSSLLRSRGKSISKKRNMIGGAFPINVNFQGQTTTFNVNPKDRIISLAYKIQNWSNSYAPNLMIYFDGELLSFQTTIREAGITQNSTIVVKVDYNGIQPPSGFW